MALIAPTITSIKEPSCDRLAIRPDHIHRCGRRELKRCTRNFAHIIAVRRCAIVVDFGAFFCDEGTVLVHQDTAADVGVILSDRTIVHSHLCTLLNIDTAALARPVAGDRAVCHCDIRLVSSNKDTAAALHSSFTLDGCRSII